MDIITQNFPFWRAILSCIPAPILSFFLTVLAIFVVIIFVKLILNFMG